MAQSSGMEFLESSIGEFERYQKYAEKALAQVSDEQFFRQIDSESNSLALIVKHIAGNLRSRWTDFLTSDGEKADRQRDREFEIAGESREALMKYWQGSWETLLRELRELSEVNLEQTVVIRHEPHSVPLAIQRSLAHVASHVGQIVFLAKHLRSSDWQTLSVPRGKSEEFNRKMIEKFKGKA